jgi:pimeloyl-ACP methyl ester carboxylesterase
MTIDTTQFASSDKRTAETEVTPPARSVMWVATSLSAGLALAALLCFAVFPGGAEPQITGSALLGFGGGWALLAWLSSRVGHPQQWAWMPAALMTASGGALLATQPGAGTMSALGWVWPPVFAAVGVHGILRTRQHVPGAGRWMLYPVLIGLVLASAGGAYLTVATAGDRARPVMPGKSYQVDGRRLHLDCHGSGSPTVVVQAGLAGSSVAWARVAPEVARTTRICAYDRAGQGWSEEGTRPHDGLQAAQDLHALLEAAGEHGPYVLAGHSTGGTYSMTFAAEYPEDVAGMVLLDSSSPHQFDLIPSMSREYAITRRGVALLPTLSRLGVGQLVPSKVTSRLPEPAAEEVRYFATSPQGLRNQRDEQAALPELFRQAQALTGLADRPLVVVTAEKHDAGGWAAAQDQLAELSSNSRHVFAPVDHGGVLDQEAGAVVAVTAIDDVVEAVRSSSRLAG